MQGNEPLIWNEPAIVSGQLVAVCPPTPRPANCGQHGLFYILPSTTMMDSPLCRKTFEVCPPAAGRAGCMPCCGAEIL